jgi:bifunctional non-homologous end joining protein LigD
MRDLLEGELGLPAFVKATGSRGMHVVTPLDSSEDFDAVRDFAQDLARLMTVQHRELTAEVRKEARKGRLFLDTARNAYAQTAVAPYTLRARDGAPVAVPLEWAEVESGEIGPQSFTITNVRKRLDAKGDAWKRMRKKARSLEQARRVLSRMMQEKAA